MASLSDFKVLSFDCYGTLIDWETGIYSAAKPILSKLSPFHNYLTQPLSFLKRFDELQGKLRVTSPTMLYPELLSTCISQLASEEHISLTPDESDEFGHSIGKWPAFPDTVAGLKILKKYYKLIIISNVDNGSIAETVSGPLQNIKCDAVLTAQDIRSYKPDHKNFFYLLDVLKTKFGMGKEELLHTAKSLPVDHVPAKELGLTSCWIARGEGGRSGMGGDLRELQDKVAFRWRFEDIGAMGKDVEKAFAEVKNRG